jgi:hypothetical protein
MLRERNDEIRDRRCKTDRDRLEKLFDLYTKMTAQQALPKKSAKRKDAKG